MPRQEIVVDVGGTLIFDPPIPGRPTAQTVQITDPAGTDVVAAGTVATLDSANQTLDGNAAVGATTLSMADASAFVVGRRYWLGPNAEARHEQVLAIGVNTTNDDVTISEPLEYAHASGVSLHSNRITYALSAANSATRDRGYIVHWSYTIGGVSYTDRTAYDVVRQRWPATILSPQRFKELVGDIGADIMQDPRLAGSDFREEIATATERLRTVLRRRAAQQQLQTEVDLFVTYDVFEAPIAELVVLGWAERGFHPAGFADAPEFLLHQRGQFTDRLEEALDTVDTYDADDSGAVDDDERTARPAPVRFVA